MDRIISNDLLVDEICGHLGGLEVFTFLDAIGKRQTRARVKAVVRAVVTVLRRVADALLHVHADVQTFPMCYGGFAEDLLGVHTDDHNRVVDIALVVSDAARRRPIPYVIDVHHQLVHSYPSCRFVDLGRSHSPRLQFQQAELQFQVHMVRVETHVSRDLERFAAGFADFNVATERLFSLLLSLSRAPNAKATNAAFYVQGAETLVGGSSSRAVYPPSPVTDPPHDPWLHGAAFPWSTYYTLDVDSHVKDYKPFFAITAQKYQNKYGQSVGSQTVDVCMF